ncbi:HAD family hydrolase [Exiguobacterium sp. s16]|uniref:HAD family hydrolase n=1 Tax=Exiguobacterium sp. s16 TaxID=2751237 RepID=UPI001BE8B0B1|nr:HAD family hydrolase [Exiguobacterium sp. s16]
MQQAVIFDMDGTLFRTETILERALDEAFERLRNEGQWQGATPIATYRNIMGVPLPVVWETLLPYHETAVREATDTYFLMRLVENIKSGNGALYPGVTALLEQLSAMGHTIFIASNGLIPYLEAIVSHYGLNRWVTETYSIEQIETLDKGDLVAQIVAEYDIQDGFVVGDRLSDIVAAKANGLIAIGCRFYFSQDDELRQADHIIDGLAEILDILATRHVSR